jgi:hypothetical protein
MDSPSKLKEDVHESQTPGRSRGMSRLILADTDPSRRRFFMRMTRLTAGHSLGFRSSQNHCGDLRGGAY